MENYSLSNEAIADLSSIWDYTKNQWSDAQAEKYTNRLFDKFENLNPKDSQKISTRFGTHYLIKHEKHVILFSLKDNSNRFILRILHRQMDLEHHMKNLDL